MKAFACHRGGGLAQDLREGDAEEEDGNNDGDLMEFFLGASARSEHVAFAAERGTEPRSAGLKQNGGDEENAENSLDDCENARHIERQFIVVTL